MNKEEKMPNKYTPIIACFFISISGIIIGLLLYFLYPSISDTFCNFIKCKQESSCKIGYWGKDCYPCLECGTHGICNGSGTRGGNGFCKCNQGWSGKYCSICNSSNYGLNCSKCDNCLNGYCNNTLKGNGNCICYFPYTGKNCDTCIDKKFGKYCNKTCNCPNGKCSNDGNCQKNSCEIGWTGINCDKCDFSYHKINDNCIKITNLTKICLDPNRGYKYSFNKFGSCQNCDICYHGMCDGIGTTRGTGKCICNKNYTGKNCQYDNYTYSILNNCKENCSNNGQCVKINTNYYCKCNIGYVGDSCQDCSLYYFKNKSKCQKCNPNHNLTNYYGKYCDKCNCQNGECDSGYNGSGYCKCKSGFEGQYCNKCKQNYYGNLCLKCPNCNHGNCQDTKNGNGKCLCKIGYSGEFCNLCQKGFIKINNKCYECPGSYGGRNYPCSNNGICKNVNNIPTCQCYSGFEGYTCLKKISTNCSTFDNCNYPNGKCIEGNCFCVKGLTGSNCNISIIKKCNNNTECSDCQICDDNKVCSLLPDCNTEFNSIIQQDIDKNIIENNKTGEALGISFISVFIFVGILIGGVLFIRNKNKIKRFTTSLTASKPNVIELTKEEVNVMNPILNQELINEYFRKGNDKLKEAVEKDNQHYFDEAIQLYEQASDFFAMYLKTETNAGTRFNVAKSIHKYLERCNYLKLQKVNK